MGGFSGEQDVFMKTTRSLSKKLRKYQKARHNAISNLLEQLGSMKSGLNSNFPRELQHVGAYLYQYKAF